MDSHKDGEMAMVDKSKTPEELAEEYKNKIAQRDIYAMGTLSQRELDYLKDGFLAGYQAAQEHAHAALEEAEARIQELRDQLMEESGGRLRLFKDEADAKAAYQEAWEDADTCEHILDMSKMVDVNGWISVKDRLPEEDQEVLIYDWPFRFTCLFWKSRESAFQWELSNGRNCNPTHWMPLPQPPKEEK